MVLEKTNCSTWERRSPRRSRSVPQTGTSSYFGLGAPEKS
jgi:hypothetical protein